MVSAVEVHVQKHRVLRLDLDAGRSLRLLKICDTDVGEEILDRYFIDGLRVWPLVEMEGRIDMGA
jgi:hypothetical protein